MQLRENRRKKMLVETEMRDIIPQMRGWTATREVGEGFKKGITK